MLNNTEDIKLYLDKMIEHYKHTSSPALAERRKTYKDIRIAIFGYEGDDGNPDKDDPQAWIH